MPITSLVEQVLDKNLCTHCGACQVACDKDYIFFNGLKLETTLSQEALECGTCDDCLAVCPGSNPCTPIVEKELFGRTRKPSERWLGIFSEVLGSKSMNPDVFSKSASGGSGTSLLMASAAFLDIDLFLVMGRNRSSPWLAESKLIDDSNELISFAQSTYQLAAYLAPLRDAYKFYAQKKIAIIGVACHIQGIRKIQQLRSDVGRWARENIKILLEIACSSNTKPSGTEDIIENVLHLQLTDVVEVRYREGKYPGEMVVKTKDNKRHSVPFWQVVKFLQQNKTHRCLSCGDWLSGLADISISDGDPNIFKGSLGMNNIEKHGRIFIRTNSGAELIRFAIQHQFLECWPITLEGQNLGLDRKRNRRAFFETQTCAIPDGPIPGYRDAIDIISDDEFLNVPSQ